MTDRSRLLALALALAASTTARPAPASAQYAGLGTIVGRVMNARSQQGIVNATVRVDAIRSVRTSADGTFALSGVTPGAQALTVEVRGYEPLAAPVPIEVRPNATVVVPAPIGLEPSAGI